MYSIESPCQSQHLVPGSVATVAASTTTYANPRSMATFNATETNMYWYPRRDIRIGRMGVVTTTTQPASGALTYTIRIGGVDTALSVTIAANSAAGYFSTTTMSVICKSGQFVTIKTVNSATATSAAIRGGGLYCYGLDMKYSKPHEQIMMVGYGNTIPLSVTRYHAPYDGTLQTTENDASKGVCMSTGILKNLFISISNTQSVTRTITMMKNSVDTPLVLTISAGSGAGLYISNTPTAMVISGDVLTVKHVNGAAISAATNAIGFRIYA